MFAPNHAPLSDKVVRQLRRGKYVHISKLIRQPARSHDPNAGVKVEKLGSLSVSMKVDTASRKVTTQLDWLEAILSSVLPAQLESVQQAAKELPAHERELAPLTSKLGKLEATLMYVLYGIVHFRSGIPVGRVIEYLEAHRHQCWSNGDDISDPDWSMLMSLTQERLASPSSSSSSSAAAYSSSSSSSSAASNKVQACGLFNKGTCKYGATCKFSHTCHSCKQPGHGLISCPDRKAAEAKPSKEKKDS